MLIFKPKPQPTSYIEQERKIQVIMSRLRLGVTLWTHGHYYKKTNPNKCHKCDHRASINHIFFECNQLETERKNLKEYFTKQKIGYQPFTIFKPPSEPEIIKFLQDAGLDIKDI